MKYKIIDLFAGIGGIRLGFEKIFDTKTVFVSEIDLYAQKTYAANFPDSPPISGDITAIDVEKIPPFDICLAGFPCQAFSIAGKRGGFNDDYHGTCRGTLFLDVVRICDRHKPKIIFCENVKGLVNHDKGRTFKIICAAFEQIGYKIFHAVLNSKNFGLAQNRERIYIVCFRKDIAPENFQFPAPTNEQFTLADVLDYAPIDAKYYLSDVYLETLRRHKARHEAAGHGFGYEIKDLNGIANALVCGGMGRERNLIVDARNHSKIPTTRIHGAINDENIRKLTPREWSRLQGFPESFKLPLSDTHLYKQFGNSVSINVIEAIAAQIRSVIDPMSGNRGEWSEIYALLKILADGAIDIKLNGQIRRLPVTGAVREDKAGFRSEFRRQKNFVDICQNGDLHRRISIDDCAATANAALHDIENHPDKKGAFEINNSAEIMGTLGLSNVKTSSNKKADIELTIHDPLTGFDTTAGYSIKSDLGEPPTLFNASNSTNFRFKVFGVDAALAERINAINEPKKGKIIRRLALIERLEFDSVINKKNFAPNLRKIDTHMDKILGEMVRLFYVERIDDCAELITQIETDDPLKLKSPGSYRYKLKKFLCAVALGLRPAAEWNGREEASGGYLIVKENGELVIQPPTNRNAFETYLLNNTRLETPSSNRYKFGIVYPYKVDGGGWTNSLSTSTCRYVLNKFVNQSSRVRNSACPSCVQPLR